MDDTKLDGIMAKSSPERSPKRPGECRAHIQVNQKCASCSGHLSFLKKAFKMACLAYTPSNVTYRGESLSRPDLLQRRQQLLLRQN